MNEGNSVTTPSTFYEPPPTGDNGSLLGAVNTDAHDSNTDNIHLTTAFPNLSITTSSNSLSINGQDSLLPPVVNPPQITNTLTVSNVVVSPSQDNVLTQSGNVDSLTGD